MAGALKGTLVGGNASIPNPLPATGSVVVAVGDLIVAVIAEQTGNTSTAAADNLGNTYTAQNAGTLSTVSGRMYYSRATVAGTLTTVNFITTASTNDASAAVAVYTGPFVVSPIDATPANLSADTTTPYSCPATGTLAQAVELCIGWIASASGTLTAGGGFTRDVEQLQSANASTHISSLVVNATTTQTPTWTGTAPTADVLGTASFKVDQTQTTFRKTEWMGDTPAFTANREFPLSLRAWTSDPQAPFPPYIAPTYMPPLIVEWGVSDRRTFEPARIQSNAALLAQPAVTYIPSRVTDWGYWSDSRVALTWAQRNVTLLSGPPSALPKNQYNWPIPTAPLPAADLRTFINDTPIQLIGKDQLPVRQQSWPVPIAADYSVSLRSFLARPSLPLLTTVVTPTLMPGRVSDWGMWERVPFSAAPLTNLTLSLPVAVAVTYLFREPYYSPQWAGARFEVWTTSVNLALLRAGPPPQKPFIQTDWPLTPAARQPDRTFQRAFPPELVGQDRLPFRQQSWPLTPATEFSNALRSIGFRSPALDVVVAVTRPFVQTDWPVPTAVQPASDLRTHIQKTPIQLIGKDRLPIRQQDWPLPIAPRPAADLRTYIAQSPIRLIGKDRLPFRQQDWPVPRAHLEFHTLRSITQGRVIYGGEVAPIPPEPPLPPPEVIHSVRAHADAYYGVFYADEIKGRADFSRAKGSNDEEAAN